MSRACESLSNIPGLIDDNGCYCDKLGNKFCSFKSLCTAYGFNDHKVAYWVKSGKDLWEILATTTVDTSTIVSDAIKVFGVYYATYESLCKAFGCTDGGLQLHKDDIEGWLLSRGTIFLEGKVYRSYSEVASAYNLALETLLSRLNTGKSLCDAVKAPVRKATGRRIPCKDHLGNEYSSKAEMCTHYGVTTSLYNYRLKNNWTIQKALTTPINGRHLRPNEEAVLSAIGN